MEKSKYYFGILAYNQENEILNTLNSIKFQIKEYGEQYNNVLIIVDDFSKDSTCKVFEKWIAENKNIFYSVHIKKNKENLGVVKNYNYILSKIDNSNFKIIAGDDLISRNNLYTQLIDDKTLLCGIKFMFKNNKIILDYKSIYQQFYLMNTKINRKKILKLFKLGFIISTPQTLYSKKLYDDSKAKELNKNFRLFEDNPTWYSMLKNCYDLKIKFIDKPIVLYRLSEKSISNSHTELNKQFKLELHKLYNIYIEEGNFFDKVYFKSLMKDEKCRMNIARIINCIVFIYFRIYCFVHIVKFKKFNEILTKEFEIEQKYLYNILNENN